MTNFNDALQAKIEDLEDEIDVRETKIELLRDLMEGEDNTPVVKAPGKRKAGRPKGSKNKRSNKESAHAPRDELYEEAMTQLSKSEEGGTTPELQKSRTASFNPQARPVTKLPKNIVAGAGKVGPGATTGSKSDANVSVDESDLGDD